ncbi:MULTISPECIES: hypothetical protein [Edwardsiella]|uniref:Uncharacterized protein n=2 Tax=Edwardsiella tarda TaxID=636 RepID=D4F378_EDWTA|nr:hypothetical protein [Edwardsiella tarda]EFE23775.1 hypothetical protein EDWATA_01180 [Edwardsiella tarda ATCC 23685]UAL57658.1 hypothetical protein K8O98_07045 [Edwardsiella tarda]UCP99283.1 hypothetical protein DCL27_11475 [Edwardsiella tarda ATCC 15947 = NBRC 105688]UCQ10508.1 hypothetical protein DCF76_11630 [Edwardsiella tarda]UCQ26794.1 hypothetical protein DCF83_12185 [Edwardsiella tarda]
MKIVRRRAANASRIGEQGCQGVKVAFFSAFAASPRVGDRTLNGTG